MRGSLQKSGHLTSSIKESVRLLFAKIVWAVLTLFDNILCNPGDQQLTARCLCVRMAENGVSSTPRQVYKDIKTDVFFLPKVIRPHSALCLLPH